MNSPIRFSSFVIVNILIALFSVPSSLALGNSAFEYDKQKWRNLMDLLLTERNDT